MHQKVNVMCVGKVEHIIHETFLTISVSLPLLSVCVM